MYTVVLIDDEPWALLGIRNCYNWEENGFEIICMTTDSEEAMEVIKTKKPHIVFTDICMPGLCGVDIMRTARSLGIDSEFVVISGYSDFKYTKEAIRYGAYHYILKPINLIEVNQVMQNLLTHLENKIDSDNNIEVANLIINMNDNPNVINNYLLLHDFPATAECYQVIITTVMTLNESENLVFPPESVHIKIYLGDSKYAYFLCWDKNIVDFAYDNWSDEANYINTTFGISTIANSLNQILYKFKEADLAVNNRFMLYPDEDRFFYYSDMGKLEAINNINSLVSNIDILNGKSTSSLNEICQYIKSNKLGFEMVTLFYNKILSSIQSISPETFINAGLEHITYDLLVKRYKDIDDLLRYITDIIQGISNNQASGNKGDLGQINKIIEYIEENFEKPLYLADISNSFYINANYICELFKKKLGVTFVEYITLVRLKHADELLRTTDYSINKVAELSGYGDYCYFGKVFKKHYGVTPFSYRNNSNNS